MAKTETEQAISQVPETEEQMRRRLFDNYHKLGGRDRVWFETNVEAVIKALSPLPSNRPPYHYEAPVPFRAVGFQDRR